MADNFDIQVSVDTSKAESDLDNLAKQKRKIDIDAELNIGEVEKQIKDLSNRKIQLDIEVGTKDQASKIAKDIERGLKNTKIDASSMAKSLADSFNISDKAVIKKMQSQINGMMSNLANTWNGKNVDLTKASGFYSGIDELGKTVSQNAKIIESKLGIYDKFYDYAKNKKIFVSDDLKKSLGTDEYKELLKNNVGKITKSATKGISIDSLWGELTSSFPEHFSDTIANQADQLRKYFDVLKSARADITKMVSTSDMTPQQLIGVSDDAFQHVVDLAGNIRDKLVQNINSATEKSKTTFDLDIEINTEKIVAGIRNALNQIDSGEAIKINLDIDKSEIETQIRSAIQGISSANTPLDIDINIDKQSIEADLKAALHNIDLPIQFKIDASDIESQIRTAISAINDIQIDVHVNADDIREEIMQGLNNNPVQIPAQIDDNPIENINRTGQEGIDIFTGLGGAVRDAFSAYTLANLLERGLDKVVEAGREAIDTVKELDDASLQLQLATGKTREEAKSMISDYRDLGNELGNLTQGVAESADSFLRQGRTIEETNTLIADSVKLATIGQLSSSDASEYLTSSMKGFNVAVDDVIGIVDKLGAVDLSAAVSAGGLAEGMSRVAVTANTAGISMDKLLGYLAVMGETSGRSMESVGTAMRTILLRMQDIKSGKLELVDEDGTTELLSDVEITLKNAGIDLRSTVTDFNNLGEVLDNLSNRWSTLNSTQQAALTKALGGQRQGEFVKILMENYDTAKKYMDIAANSSGMADEKFANYLDSLEAKTNKLKNSLEALATDTITDGLYEGFLETATAAADFARETDLVNTALIGLGTAGTTYVFRNLSTMIANTVTQVNALGGGLRGLWGVLSGHPIALVTAGVVAAVGAWNLYQSTIKSANEKMAESFSAYEQAQSEVENVNNELLTTQSRIDELNAKQSLTFVEQSELDKLQEANEKLLLQLDLREKEEQRAARQASEDTVSAYEKTYGKFGISESKTKEYIDNAELTGNNAILLSDENNISAMIAGIRQMQKLRQEAFNSNDGYEVERYDEIINDATDSVWEQVTALDDYKSKLEAVKEAGGSLNTEEQNALSEIESTIEYVYKQLDPEKWNQMQFDNIFNQSSFSDAKESLKQIAKESDNIGISAEQVKNKFPELVAEMEKAGFSAQDIANNINSQLGLLDFAEVKRQLKEAFAGDLNDNATLEELRKSDYRGLEMKKLLDGKSEEEITLFYKYVNDGDIDLSDLTLEDIEELFITVNADTTPAQKSLEELTESANDVVSSINSINSVLSSQGTGKSISIGDFNSDELKDYQTALEYVNGSLQLNTEKVNAITKAKADETIAINEANKAQRQSDYLKNAGEIEQLRAKLKTLNEGEEEYINTKTRLDSLLSDNSAIVSECQQYDLLSASIREATSAYQNWLDKQNSTESGDMFDSSMNAIQAIRDVADSESEDYGRVGTNRYKAAVDFIVPDSIDSSDATAVQSYIDSIGKYFDYDENGNRVGMDITQFCNDAVKEGLMNIEVDADGKEFFNLADGVKMEDFADKLKLTSAMVQAFFGEMQEFGGEFSWADEAIQTVGDLGVKAYESAEALRNMDVYSDISIKMDVSDIENVDDKVASLDATIQQMNDLKAEVPVDASEVQYANDVIQYCVAQKQSLNEPVFMSIDTSQVSSDLAEVISMFQQLQSAKNDYDIQASIGADTTEAQGKIDSLVSQIQEKSPQIKATIGEIDTSNVDTILAGVAEKSAEMWVTLGVNEDAITGYVPENKKATVTYELDSTAVDAYNPRNIRRTVTYTIVTEGEAPKVNGTAHADGTAFSNGSVKVPTDATSIKRIGRALASGSWGVKKSENALVGELGRELIVYGNRYWTVGDDSAEFTHIPKGAIVFNHKQTEEIFKNGYVTSGGGRGKAYAQGTAYVTGGIGVNNANKTVAVSSSSSSTEKSTEKSSTKSTDKNTKAVDKNTKAVEEAKDEFSELIDWAERLISNYERATDAILNRVDDYELYRNQNKQIDLYLDSAQKQVNMLRSSQNMYASKANAVDLSDDYKRKIRNGELSIEEITDEDLKKKIEEYEKYYSKTQELGDKITELNRSMRETKISKLENILDDYDNLISYHEALVNINDSMNELYEIRNNVGNQNALWNNLDQQKQMKTYYQASVKEMQAQLDKMVADGTIGLHSDTWIEWTNNISEAKKAIIECDIAVEELKQSILEIRYDAFEKMIDNLEHASDMTAALRDLMPTEGFFDDNAKITKSGYAQLALMAEELVNAKQRVANYNTAIEALDEDLKDGNISQAQYNEKLKEYQSAQMDAVKATKAARDAILDMVKEGINKETEAMEKLIQKRKNDLSLQKEYYDFQEKMKDQSAEMNKIRVQINALEGDDSLEAQSKRRKLNSQLQELQKQYDKDIKDREYDVVQDAYDETLDKFKENQEDTLHELETNLEAQNQAIENYLALTKENYRAAYDELLTYGNEYNIKLTEQLTKPWEDAQNAMNTYVQAVGSVEPNVSIETGKIQANDNGSNPTSSNQVGAESTTLKSSNGTWINQEGKWWYKHDDGSYTKNGWEQIDGKWYKFDENGWMQSGWQAWGTDSTGNTAWYYLGEPGDGSMKTSEWIKDDNGKYYFVDHTGMMARYGYIKSKNSDLYYWVNNSGEWEPQWDTYTPDLKKYKEYYARGTKRVSHDTIGYMDDTINHNLALGSEIIITDKGVLRQFNAGDMVLNGKQTEFLYELSKNPSAYLQDLVKIPKLDGLSVMRENGSVNVHFDTLLTVNGDIDKEVFPGVQKMCEKACEYTTKKYKEIYNIYGTRKFRR